MWLLSYYVFTSVIEKEDVNQMYFINQSNMGLP